MAGLEQAIEYIRELHFEDEDIEYLKSKGIFDEQFLEYLRNFKFSGDVYAIPEELDFPERACYDNQSACN